MSHAATMPSVREILPGVVLSRSGTGSYSVVDHGRFAGWLHASLGDEWAAHVEPGRYLGKFKQDAAVRAVVRAFHERNV